MQDLMSELIRVWPDATRVILGQHEVFRHHDETPGHRYDAVIKFLAGPRLLELTARDSFDQRLAGFLLDRIDLQALPGLRSRRIHVFAVQFPAPWLFETIVLVPPAIAQRFEHESIPLRRATYWAFPAFAWEFRDGEDGEGFWHQVQRRDGWNVIVVRWDRCRKIEPSFER